MTLPICDESWIDFDTIHDLSYHILCRIQASSAGDALSDISKDLDASQRSSFEQFTELLTTLFPVWVSKLCNMASIALYKCGQCR
jgi:hypothetical protein